MFDVMISGPLLLVVHIYTRLITVVVLVWFLTL